MMAKQKDIFAKARAYFKDNWTDTPLQIPEQDFDNDNYVKYIRFAYTANGSELVGLHTPQTAYGYVMIHCYHKNEILSVDLADDVKTFFENNTALGSDIYIKDGQIQSTVKLDNDYYNTVVMFSAKKYS